MEGAPKPKGPEGGENGGENLQELRDKLKSFLGSSSDEAKAVIAKNEKIKDVTADNIDDLSDEDLKELNKAVEEYLSSAEVLIDQHVNKLMGLSFAAFFSVVENFEREHPDAPKLKGYSRKSVEEFVRANLSNPGAEGLANISEFEERLEEQQRVVDQVKQQRGGASGDTGGASGDTGGTSGDTGGSTGDTGGASGDAGHDGDPSDFETKKKEKVKEILDKLFDGADSLRPGVFLETDPDVAFDDPANAYDRAKAEERLLKLSFIGVTEDNLDDRAQKKLDKLLERKKIIEDINTRFEVDKIKKVLTDEGLTTYTDRTILELKDLIKKLEADGNDAENRDKRKKRKRGHRVWGAIIATGLAAATALSMISLFGGGRKQAAVKTIPTEITMDVNELEEPTEPTEGVTDPTESQNEIVDEAAAEDAESQESMWDAAHGNDARGLWASMDGEDANPDKDGSHDLVAASEFAEFTQDKLETEDGQQEFKDHLVDVATREGVVMEQIADYAQQHGDLDFLPASIRGLEGEELEDAIKENRDGCYDELVKNLQEKLAKGDVSIDYLQAGTYDNYFAHLTNPDAPATIDNLELERCQTWENVAPVFKIAFEDGSTWMMKGKCIQLVELVTPPTTTTTTTTTETSPPTTTTTTTTETSPPTTTTTTTTETPPPTTTTTTTPETPPPTTTTTTTDNSKHEEALAAGQGTDVAGAEEGYRIVEDTSQEPYVYDFTAPVSPDALNADQTFIEYNFADETQEQEAAKKAAAAQEQQKIDAQRGAQEAEAIDIDTLGGSGF